MILNKLTLLFFITSLCCSCTQNNVQNFTIKGRVENPPSGFIYLEKLSYDGSSAIPVDSSKVEHGTYQLKSIAQEEGLYVISFQHNPAIILVNDSKEAEINFDMKKFRMPFIAGSDATQKLYTFIHHYFSQDSVLSLLSYRLDTLKSANGNVSVIDSLQKEGSKQLANLNEIVTKFIEQSKSPASICFALDKAKASMPIDKLERLAKESAEKYKTHSGLAIFKSQIAQLAADKTNPENGSYPLLNQTAPDLIMDDLNGKPLSISSFKGKYLLVDFWASWCGPCRQENPNVVKAYNLYKGKNFEILGVSLDKSKSAWMQAIEKDKLNWPQMSDLKEWQSIAVGAYKIEGIPFNVLLNPEGKIIASSLRGEALEEKLAEVLK